MSRMRLVAVLLGVLLLVAACDASTGEDPSSTPSSEARSVTATTGVTAPLTTTVPPASTTSAADVPAQEPRLVVTPQAGHGGVAVIIEGRGFDPADRVLDVFVLEAGSYGLVGRIPRAWVEEDGTFRTGFVESSRVGGTGAGGLLLTHGDYLIAVGSTGNVVEGGRFTRLAGIERRVEIIEVFETMDQADPIGTVELENRRPGWTDLSEWSLVDEIVPTSTLIFPEGTRLGPGERLYIEYQRDQCPSETEADFVVCTDPPRGAVLWDAITLRDADSLLVDRHIVTAPCPWVFQPDAPQCGYALFHDPDVGLRFEIPGEGWAFADESLTPVLGWEQVFAAATYSMRPGGDRCAQFPEFALEDLGPYDALVHVVAAPPSPAAPNVAKPDEFTLSWIEDHGAESVITECLTRLDRDEMFVRWFGYLDQGRVLFMTVAIGRDTPGETITGLLDILNGLDFDPR